MELIISYWQAAEARGEQPRAVYAVFSGEKLIWWSTKRREAAKRVEEVEGSRLAKISPV